MPLCNGTDISCVSYSDNITGHESGLTFAFMVLHTRELDKSAYEDKADDDGASCWCSLKRSEGMVRH